jgi:thiol-disulfide isomerase/thioredoxin
MLLELFVIAFTSSFANQICHYGILGRNVILIAAASLALAACDRQSPDAGQGEADESAAANADSQEKSSASIKNLSGKLDISRRGDPMPDVAFFTPDNETVQLEDFKGKPLLVNLWATWCGPCVIELPTLEALAERESERLQVLVISQDTQKTAEVAPFLKERGLENLAPYVDPENNLGFAYATGVIPTTVLYDAKGNEVWRVIGGMDWNGSRISAMMEDTLQGQ